MKKICLLTGANGSIGRVISETLLKSGNYKMILNYHVKIKYVNQLKERFGDDVLLMQCDVTNPRDVTLMVETAIKKWDQIDLLINNAGIIRDAFFKTMSEENWNEVIDVNLNGVYLVSSCIYPYMIKNKFGNIINISSIVGEMGNMGQVNYSAAKAGLIGFTRSLAKEAARYNIRVNAIAPGFIDSDMTSSIPPGIMDGIINNIPLKRLGNPREIAMAVQFICSCNYLTGSVIDINGGLHL